LSLTVNEISFRSCWVDAGVLLTYADDAAGT